VGKSEIERGGITSGRKVGEEGRTVDHPLGLRQGNQGGILV